MPAFIPPNCRSFKRAAVAGWKLDHQDKIGLLDVIRNAKPTVLIGVSGQAGVFTEEIVRAMTQYAERPIIFPLSNPAPVAEATPADLIAWTDGRALIATGSPFPPVTYRGVTYVIGQVNNAMLYPGLCLGAIVSRARRISDNMFAALGYGHTGLLPNQIMPASTATCPGCVLTGFSQNAGFLQVNISF